MLKDKIIIGRRYDCDIRIEERFAMVSNHHAVLSVTPHGIVFEDISTNGSTVNGIRVCHRAVNVRLGDLIVLAGQYQVRWEIINRYLVSDKPTMTTAYMQNPTQSSVAEYSYINSSQAMGPYIDDESKIDKWNWGAFTFSWIWAISNKIYWPLVVFIPFFGWIALPIISIFLGAKGNKWAWEKSSANTTASQFISTQKTWNTVGLIFFCISIIVDFSFLLILFAKW